MKLLGRKSIKIIAVIVVFAMLLIYFGPQLMQMGVTTEYINDISELTTDEQILLTPMLTGQSDWNVLDDPLSSPLYITANAYVYLAMNEQIQIIYSTPSGNQIANVDVSTYPDGNDLIRKFTTTPVAQCSGYISGPSIMNEFLINGWDICTLMLVGTVEYVLESNSQGWRFCSAEIGPYQTDLTPDDDVYIAVGMAHADMQGGYIGMVTSSGEYADGSGGGMCYYSYVQTYVQGSFLRRGLKVTCNKDWGEFHFHDWPYKEIGSTYSYNENDYMELDPVVLLAYVNDPNIWHYWVAGGHPNGWGTVEVGGFAYWVVKETNPSNVICASGATECVGNTLHKCSLDGTQILYKNCDSCQGGNCVQGWVNINCPPIQSGFTLYEAMTSTQIKKTTHNLVVSTIPVLAYNENVDLTVTVGGLDLDGVPIVGEFFDDSGSIVDTFYGNIPIFHAVCPLYDDGTLKLTVTHDGKVASKTFDVYITQPTISANFPQPCVKGQDITVEVNIEGMTATPVDIEFRDNNDVYVDTFYGTTPNIPVTWPLATDGTMKITATYGGATVDKTYNVQTTELNIVVVQPDAYITGLNFDIGVTFSSPSIQVPISVDITDGTNSETYTGAMPSITIQNPQYNGATTITISATYLNDQYTRTIDVNFEEMTLVVTGGTYEYGLTTTINAYIHQFPSLSVPLNVKIMKNGMTLEEYDGTTPQITLTKPKALGSCDMVVYIDYYGGFTETVDVFFTGSPIGTTARTDSLVQYEMDPITFFIDVFDINGEYMTPNYITNIQSICTLSLGTVTSSSFVHQGDGTYKITSHVVGVGNFIGKLQFEYLDTAFTSDSISISIEENSLSISTSDMPSFATRGKYFTGIVEVYGAKGSLIDPDNLECLVQYPDGETTQTILFGQFSRVGIGHYEFQFKAAQLETYTFVFTAEKQDITTASSTAHVSIHSETDEPKPGDDILGMILAWILGNLWILIILFVGIIIALWKFII